MTDLFATLQQPRRPWLDPAALKDQFHALSARHHPDAAGGDTEAFGEVNRAYQTLRDPASRLKHLLALEYPRVFESSETIAPLLADRFMEIATLRRELDVFLHGQGQATTPLTQALQASERFALKLDLEKALASLELDYSRCLELLKAEDEIWAQRTEGAPVRLSQLANELSYLGKWIEQMREGLHRLEG